MTNDKGRTYGPGEIQMDTDVMQAMADGLKSIHDALDKFGKDSQKNFEDSLNALHVEGKVPPIYADITDGVHAVQKRFGEIIDATKTRLDNDAKHILQQVELKKATEEKGARDFTNLDATLPGEGSGTPGATPPSGTTPGAPPVTPPASPGIPGTDSPASLTDDVASPNDSVTPDAGTPPAETPPPSGGMPGGMPGGGMPSMPAMPSMPDPSGLMSAAEGALNGAGDHETPGDDSDKEKDSADLDEDGKDDDSDSDSDSDDSSDGTDSDEDNDVIDVGDADTSSDSPENLPPYEGELT